MADEYGDDDPHATDIGDPYASSNPYASSDDNPYASITGEEEGGDEVSGMLGGATGEEELPALPGVEDPDYSHRDFMDSGEADAYADPYADPYAEKGQYDDPYALPPASEYDDYEGYDDGAVAESDPSYFDSMGHEDGLDVQTRTAGDYDDYDDGSPKTISQQDAESIIRRITTKRILPPDQEAKPSGPRTLTPSGGGLRIWPILLVVLILSAGTVWVFREPIAKAIPALAPFLGVELEAPPTVDDIKREKPEVVLKRKMLRKVLISEMKAFGVTDKDLGPAKKPADKKPADKKPADKTPEDKAPGEETGSDQGGEGK